MVDSIGANSAVQQPAVDTHSDHKPMPMPASVADQSSQPAMNTASPVAMTIRQRPAARQAETATADSDRSPHRPAENRASPGTPSHESPSFLSILGKVVTSLLAASAAYRGVRNPMDFVQHPGKAILGTITLGHRADASNIAHGNNSVINHFGKYIPNDSACYHTKAEVSFELPFGEAGNFNHDKNELKISAYRHFGAHPNHPAVHEFIHCYTHPDFRSETLTLHEQALFEGVTEHLTDKLPVGPWPLHLDDTSYHSNKLSNGKVWTQAAAEIEQKVGEETLLKAVFSGDKQAISDVSSAVASIYPKSFNKSTWNNIGLVTHMRGTQELAECYIGAMAANQVNIPDIFSKTYLPVFSLDDISTEQRQQMAKQAKACEERMGDVFNAAFFGFDKEGQRDALKAVREDVKMFWQPVLKNT